MPQTEPTIKGAGTRSARLQTFHQAPMRLRNRNRAVRRPRDIDVGVAASRGGLVSVRLEHREVVAHRGAAEMFERDADFRRLGIREARIETAAAFDNQAYDRARSRI